MSNLISLTVHNGYAAMLRHRDVRLHRLLDRRVGRAAPEESANNGAAPFSKRHGAFEGSLCNVVAVDHRGIAEPHGMGSG